MFLNYIKPEIELRWVKAAVTQVAKAFCKKRTCENLCDKFLLPYPFNNICVI